MSWLDRWLPQIVFDIAADVSESRRALLDITTRIKKMEKLMAADRDLLVQLAADLTALAGPIQGVFDALAAANARLAELEGQAAADEAADLAAIAPVKQAFDTIAAKFQAEPEVPDVEPLPEPAPEQ